MNQNPLIATVTSAVVSTATAISLDTVVKIVTPPTLQPLTQLAVKGITTIANGFIAASIGSRVRKTTQEIVDTVYEVDSELESTQDPN